MHPRRHWESNPRPSGCKSDAQFLAVYVVFFLYSKRQCKKECRNLMPLTPLFKGSDVPTEVGLTGTQEQTWPDALPSTTSDSCGYQQESITLTRVPAPALKSRSALKSP